MAPFLPKIEMLRELQREFQRHTGVRDFSAKDGVSPGICHEVAREQHRRARATSSRRPTATPAWAARTTRSPGASAPPSTRRSSTPASPWSRCRSRSASSSSASCAPDVTAKDVMLHILLDLREAAGDARPRDGVRRPGRLDAVDGRARDARQHGDRVHGARAASSIADDETFRWIAAVAARASTSTRLRARAVEPDAGRGLRRRRPRDRPLGARADGGRTRAIPTAASPPIRPTARWSPRSATCRIDIAYGGCCTAGKIDDLDFYDRVVKEAVDAGRRVAPGRRVLHPVRLARRSRATRASTASSTTSRRPGVRLIHPGCGACIGCGPGVSDTSRPGHRLGDQPQLQGPLRPRQALARVPAHRRRLGLHRQHHRLHAGNVRARRDGALSSRRCELIRALAQAGFARMTSGDQPR